MHPTELARAVAAVRGDAYDRALAVDEVQVVQNSSRIAVRLLPCDVLARVIRPGRRNHDGAALEVEVARRLSDGPAAGPEPRVEPRVYVRDGFAITYWRHYTAVHGGDRGFAAYAEALERLHAAMRKVSIPAPHFTDRIDEAEHIVHDPDESPDLAVADRELLTVALGNLRRAVLERTSVEQLLHGEPHPGNLLRTEDGLLFIDFETCCRGPVEFDLAHVPDQVAQHYPGLDPELLRDCRLLVPAMLAAWRSSRDDDFPDRLRAREDLLMTLRSALTP